MKLTRRSTMLVIAIAAVATLVSAALLANYIVPNNSYRVTSGPGLTAYESDGTTQISSIAWGDIQIPSPSAPNGVSQTHQIILKNTGGSSFTLYIIDQGTCVSTNGGACSTVSFLNPTGLAAGVSLTSNFDSLQTAGGLPFTCTVGTTVYNHCMALTQGSATPVITLTLSASASATPTTTSQNFSLEFDSYSTPLG